MIPRIHAAAGVIGFLCILTFWTSTVGSELFSTHETITAVKHAVLWGMWLLVPCMAAAGATGFKLLGSRTEVLALAKKRRMMVIGPNEFKANSRMPWSSSLNSVFFMGIRF